MNKKFFKEIMFSLSVLAGVLLVILSTGNETRAALSYQTEVYKAKIQTSQIGVTLLENGNKVASRDNEEVAGNNRWVYFPSYDPDERTSVGTLNFNNQFKNANPKIGCAYTEKLAVKNSGNIDTYVRLIIRKYWTDGSGKLVNKDPGLIKLYLDPTDEDAKEDAWIEDTNWGDDTLHPETTVLYYKNKLGPGETTPPAVNRLQIDEDAATTVERTPHEGGYTVTTTYVYDNKTFVIEVEADAVQTNNAADAMRSAWGLAPAGINY